MSTSYLRGAGNRWLAAFFLVSLACGKGAMAAGASSYQFSPEKVGLHRVKISLQLQGKLKILGADEKERQIPLQVSGNFVYDEKIEANPTIWSSRFYQTAEADIRLDKDTHKPTLPEERRHVGVRFEGAKAHFWSPGGPLSRDEAELIDLQANSVLLSALLPGKAVKIGDTWKPDEATLAALLTIDVVNSSDVVCKLAEVKNGRAVVEVMGGVSGAVDGVATEIELSAKYAYHLGEQRFTSLALAVNENRSISKAEPGFQVAARMTMTLAPLTTSQQLTAADVASIQQGLGLAPPLRYESTVQGFRVLLDPRWRVIMDRNEVTVLRLVDGGDVVAQCNVSSLPPLAEGRLMQLEEFQQDIQKSLGENFGQFVEASQSENANGLRVLRVAAAGIVSELPIHWIYYHVSDEAGHRLSYVFTLEAELAERFGGADAPFTATLELFEPAPSAQAEQAPVKSARAK